MAWYSRLSIRWKLQLGFFVVTMFTTLFNRWLATKELDKAINTAEEFLAPQDLIDALVVQKETYIFNSVWESGIEFTIQFAVIGIVASIFVRPLLELIESLKAVGKGDLTQTIETRAEDEIGTLVRHFNAMLSKLNEVLSSVDASSSHMKQSAYQIALVSQEIAEIGEKENGHFEDVAQVIKDLHQISEDVESIARQSHQRATIAKDSAVLGVKNLRDNIQELTHVSSEVEQASDKVQQLDQSADQITKIVGGIREIAEQTNLLALNAAIEAARAGEQGRGFAVVADEVRALAEKTTNSSGEINQIIEAFSEQVTDVTKTMAKVATRVRNNTVSAEDTAQQIAEMETAALSAAEQAEEIEGHSDRQLKTFTSLELAMDKLLGGLQQNTSKVSNTANIGESLYELTNKMSAMLEGFSFLNVADPEASSSDDDRRQHPRASSNLLVQINSNNQLTDGFCQDVSLSGMRVSVATELQEGQQIELQMRMPSNKLEDYNQQEPVCLVAQVARKIITEHGRNIYGLQFAELDRYQTSQLKRCVDFFGGSQ